MPINSAHPLPPMKNDEILSQITAFCRKADMAESTFGRRAVNDGKLVHRLREGKLFPWWAEFGRSPCPLILPTRSHP